jgi:hypothetical protein
MTAFETDLLGDLVQEKHRCLEHLAAMGQKQLDLIRRGSMTDLLDLLATKQQVLLQLQRIEREMDPFRGQDPESRRWRSSERRRQCASGVSACEALLERIIAQEKQSEAELTRRRDEAAARLHQTRSAGAARASYLARHRFAASQLDLTSEG